MSISASLLPEFEREMAGTRLTIERIPEDKLTWRPHPRSVAMGRLATHLVELAGFAQRVISDRSFDIGMDNSSRARELQSRVEILGQFDRNFAEAKVAIAATPDREWMTPWTLTADGKIVFTLPRLAVMRNSVLNHTIHHRGQLTLYLRLNDVAVPGLYGPSADE